MVTKKRGGVRPGAGRPAKQPEEVLQRRQRQLRAFDDEWTIINQFADMVKHWDRGKCKAALEKLISERQQVKSSE